MFRLISVSLVSFAINMASVHANEQEPAQAAELLHGKLHLETCMAAALAERAGRVIKVEMKREAGGPVYEFDIRDNNARDWDIECDADSGEIIEIEQEVTTPRHPLFQEVVTVSEQSAREIARKSYAGVIVETEYEIESDGRAVYEFDIRQEDGTEMKVEIDAATGEVHEANREFWQIGYE